MTSAKTHRVLSLSTLWPNASRPRYGTFVARSLEGLQRNSHWDVTLINPIGVPPIAYGAHRDAEAAAVDGLENGIEVHRPIFRMLPKLGGRLNPGLIARTILPLARRLHAEKPFDLVDAQYFYPDGPAAVQIAKALHLPLSVKARGADIHYWGARSYGRTALLDTARRAAGLLAVSGALVDDMATLGMDRDKITIHYTGLDRDRFRPLGHTALRGQLSEELGIPIARDDKLLVTVGSLIERKGQAKVLQAMAGIPGTRLLLVGRGEDKGRLGKLAAELGIADRVHFLGSIDHDFLPPILSAADVMVLPSESEGLANAWIESLACGTPLVITDAGGAREIVRSPESGVIVADNPGAVRRGIERVLARHVSPEAVAATVANFSWETNAEALARHYDRIIGG